MKIEVLYFPGCPHRSIAVEEIERALASEKIEAPIAEIEVRDEEEAARHVFYGSPTIRINGRDVSPVPSQAATVGLQCRIYPGGEHPGVPPRDSLRSALREAVLEERN